MVLLVKSVLCSLKLLTSFESGVHAWISVDEWYLSHFHYLYIPPRQSGWLWSVSNWFRISLFLRMFKNIKTSRVHESAKKVGGGGGKERERKEKRICGMWEHVLFAYFSLNKLLDLIMPKKLLIKSVLLSVFQRHLTTVTCYKHWN